MIKPKDIPEIVRADADHLKFAYESLDIYNGNLSPYVDKELYDQLSLQSYAQIRKRMSTINILTKVVDKLTNIYQTSVLRQVIEGSDQDKELLGFYEDMFQMNETMNLTNESFNLTQQVLLQPYAYKGKPRLRYINKDKFVVYSEDPIEPHKPTHYILIYKSKDEVFYWVWTENEVYAVDRDGNLRPDIMQKAGLESSANEIGAVPFIYVNGAKNMLQPIPDWDGLKMVKLLPVMLSDLNGAAMFQCFSILYTINASGKGLKYAPNAVWEFDSDPTNDKEPKIGVIKPEVDYDQVIKLIESQISMWLGTKGIRASSIGTLSTENFASGISKIIDEMDTFEARQKQVTIFQRIEKEFWDLIINKLHPYWTVTRQIDNLGMFSVGASIKTEFAVQLPMQSRGQIVRDLKEEYAAGFISRKKAISKLNPHLTSEEIEELIEEIDTEQNPEPENPQPQTNPVSENLPSEIEDEEDDDMEENDERTVAED